MSEKIKAKDFNRILEEALEKDRRRRYKAMCKCRLCGKIFEIDDIDNEFFAYVETFEKTTSAYKNNEPYKVHECEDGSYGFADFIGVRKV